MSNRDWVKNFVVYSAGAGKWVAYDETQAYELGYYDTEEEAVDVVLAYGEWVVEQLKEGN